MLITLTCPVSLEMPGRTYGETKENQTLAEGVFLPSIDFNMAVWMAYLNCIQMPVIGRHAESFASALRILDSMILPDWHDAKYDEDIEGGHGVPVIHFKAITNLLHRRGFFRQMKSDLGHL